MRTHFSHTEVHNFNYWYLYTAIVVLYTITYYITVEYIYTPSFYHEWLSGIVDHNKIEYSIEKKKKYTLIGYIIQPITVLLKCAALTCALYAGITIFSVTVSFRNCFKIVLLAELVSFCASFAKVAAYFLLPSLTAKNFQYFFPLSITSIFSLEGFPEYLRYPLNQLNIFEVIYWMILTYGLRSLSSIAWTNAAGIILCSCGLAVFLWHLTIIFIHLQFN